NLCLTANSKLKMIEVVLDPGFEVFCLFADHFGADGNELFAGISHEQVAVTKLTFKIVRRSTYRFIATHVTPLTTDFFDVIEVYINKHKGVFVSGCIHRHLVEHEIKLKAIRKTR